MTFHLEEERSRHETNFYHMAVIPPKIFDTSQRDREIVSATFPQTRLTQSGARLALIKAGPRKESLTISKAEVELINAGMEALLKAAKARNEDKR
jgi:hypothetical protein